MSKSRSSTARRLCRAGLATGVAVAAVAATTFTSTPAYAAIATVVASPASGPEATLTPIQLTSATAFLSGITSPQVTFSIAACQTTYNSTASTPAAATASTGNVVAGAARKLSDFKVAVTVPITVVTEQAANAAQKWNVCIYASSATSPAAAQIGVASYTVGAAAAVSAASPSSGATAGGNTVTFSGTGLPATVGTTGIISATIDGVPLTGLKAISDTAFSGIMPAHSAEKNLTLQVNTNVGTAYLKNAYTYENGLSVTPNTAPSFKGIIDISVIGSNLLTPTFTAGTASDTAGGHVYLVEGKYDPAPDATTPANKANGPVAECTDILVFSNTELVCRLQLWQRLTPAGGFEAATTRVILNDVDVEGTLNGNITSPTANFTPQDVGKLIKGADTTVIKANTFIKSVTSPTAAVMSQVGQSTGTVATATIGGDRVATVLSMTGSTITAAAGTFSTGEVGRRIDITAGLADVPLGTVITSVDSTGATAVVSQPAITTGGTTATGVTIYGASDVPDGAYVVTVVNSGLDDAETLDPNNYSQSVVSSGSTFTVANY
jgi:hypothetical protein